MPVKVTPKRPGPIPKEAIEYLKNKKLDPDQKTWGEEHNLAFTVAQIAEIDILADVKVSLEGALEEGITFRIWAQAIKPILDGSGWSNYTGTKSEVHRLNTIYDANMRTARAAGQWERIQRTKHALPYMRYNLGPSARHRPVHESWEGTVLPVDDPWWNSHMTPNGYLCKCFVTQITRRRAEAAGISKRPKTIWVEVTNKKTGVSEILPKGIDPGWNHNPGKNRKEKLDQVLKTRNNPAPGPSKKFPSSGAMFRSLLRQGKLSDVEVLNAVRKRFDLPIDTSNYIAWYKAELKRNAKR